MPGLPSHIHHKLLTLYNFALPFLSIALILFVYLFMYYPFINWIKVLWEPGLCPFSPFFILSDLVDNSQEILFESTNKIIFVYLFFQLECKLLANKVLVPLINSCVPGAQHCSWPHEKLPMTVLNDQKHGADGASWDMMAIIYLYTRICLNHIYFCLEGFRISLRQPVLSWIMSPQNSWPFELVNVTLLGKRVFADVIITSLGWRWALIQWLVSL